MVAVAKAVTTNEKWSLSKDQGKFLRVVTVSTANQVLKEEQAKGTFPRDRKLYTTWVDNSPRKQEIQVRFGGKISYIQRQALSEVYEFILRRIEDLAPIGPGPKKGKEPFRRRHYYESTVMLVNGKAVITEGQAAGDIKILALRGLKNIKPSDRVQFMNVQPYARRIEQGKTEYRSVGKGVWRRQRDRDTAFAKPFNWSLQAPNGVFKVVAREAARRFKGVAQVRFTYAQAPALGYAFKDLRSGDRINQFYPVIVVRTDRGAFEEGV